MRRPQDSMRFRAHAPRGGLVVAGVLLVGSSAAATIAIAQRSSSEPVSVAGAISTVEVRPATTSISPPSTPPELAVGPGPELAASRPEPERPSASPAPANEASRTPMATALPLAGGGGAAALPLAGGAPNAAGGAGGAPEANAGANAGEPVLAACGATVCPAGQVCCNPSCGIFTAPGRRCSQTVCGMQLVPESVPCGPNTCNVGERCCNPSCGICVGPGESCDDRACNNPITYPESHTCGMMTCNVGLVCCNPSCGICAAPGAPCSQEPC